MQLHRVPWPLLSAVAVLVVQPGGHASSHAAEPAGRVRICASTDFDFRSPTVIKLPARAAFEKSSWVFLGTDLRASSLEEGTMPPPTPEKASFITTAPVTLTKAHPCAEVGARMLLREAWSDVPTASASDGHIWHFVQVLDYSHWRQPNGLTPLIDDALVRAVPLTDLGDPETFTLAQEIAADPDMREDVEKAQRMARARAWPPIDELSPNFGDELRVQAATV